ncbi:DUF3263 domain-containing protein [Corynebacterium testudinoris]|uniref:Putative DUF3263 family protein n=1 Tax=Corynebacterium testudinoris TaxID=136857 RepID=A0A0G3H8Q4_9CORY|nr:DUF3263 domain-containing protein [Corynebacterium testudinoris]AKK09776.1 putative DUF3263 family protein [Corynebacterium testudinoris]MBX8996737.1 DUF3263 domain-containing protein [Corynebacterium testudinoris]
MLYSLGMSELSESDARLLAFEERAPRSAGTKEEAIRAQLGISPVRYYQRLNLLIDVPAAMSAHPVLLSRLRRVRDRRAGERALLNEKLE